MALHLLASTTLVLATAAGASGQFATYKVIPNAASANDMTPDGRFVCGGDLDLANYRYDRITGEVLVLEPEGFDAVGISDDGSVIVGDVADPMGIGSETAGRWTEEGWESLGALPNALGCPSRSNSYEVSADGSAVVGLSWDGCSGRAFRWTEATGMVELQVLANGGNRASVISADGSIIAGFAQGSSSRTPAVWSSDATGALLDPPNGDANGEVRGMSDDGSILLGNWDEKPFLLEVGQPIEIWNPVLPGWVGAAMDIAEDGTIVGFDFLLGNRRAWIRPQGGPAQDLHAYLTNLGVTGLPPILEVPQEISSNGNIITGHNSFNPGWMVNLCPPDLSGNDDVDFADILAVIGSWGPCSGCAADLDDSGDVGFSDILAVIGGWGPCP